MDRWDASLSLTTDQPWRSKVNRDIDVLSIANCHSRLSLKPMMYWNRQRDDWPCPTTAILRSWGSAVRLSL